VFAFATMSISPPNPDPVLSTTATPAVQARNHAASPQR
jgi:hypothetical protein